MEPNDAPKRITQMENEVEVEYEPTGEYRVPKFGEYWYSTKINHHDYSFTITTKYHIYRVAPVVEEVVDEVKVGDVFQHNVEGYTAIVRGFANDTVVNIEMKDEPFGMWAVSALLKGWQRLPSMPVEVGQVWKGIGLPNCFIIITKISNDNIHYSFDGTTMKGTLHTEYFTKKYTFHGWDRGEKVEAPVDPENGATHWRVRCEAAEMELVSLRSQLAICNAENERLEKEKNKNWHVNENLKHRVEANSGLIGVLKKERDDARARVEELEKELEILDDKEKIAITALSDCVSEFVSNPFLDKYLEKAYNKLRILRENAK